MFRQQQASHRSSVSSPTAQKLTEDVFLQPSEHIGKGSFSFVFKGQMRTQNGFEPVAIKRFNLTTSDPELCQKEISVLKKLNSIDCKNLVKYHTEVTRDSHLYLVLEYCNYGDLWTHLNRCGKFHFRHIQHFLKQICSALRVLHDNDIMHRDLKPQNMMLHCEGQVQKWEQLTVKLCDFGFAGVLSEQQMCYSVCGSPVYMAPEVMFASDNSLDYSGYGPQADLYSLGVTIFQLATNDFPFPVRHQRPADLMNFHRTSEITKKTEKHPDLDNLLKGLLRRDMRERITLVQMQRHPFLTTIYPPTTPASPKWTPTKRTSEEEESKCYGWYNNEKREKQRQKNLRQAASCSPQPERPCEVLYRQIKPGDPFEDLPAACRKLPSTPVPVPRGHSRRRDVSKDSSLFGSILGSVHYHASGIFGSILPKPRVRHEVGDSSRFAQLDVQDGDDDFVVICEKEKEKPKPKPVYRYERIATTRCPDSIEQHMNSRKSGLREETKKDHIEVKTMSPETTTKKLKSLESSREMTPNELMAMTQLTDEMFQTAYPDERIDEDEIDDENGITDLSEDIFASCCERSMTSLASVEERPLRTPKQRTNSAASIDSGVSMGSVESLSLIPVNKVDQFVEQLWDNRYEGKRETFGSISDPNLANLLRMINPVLEYEAGIQRCKPFEGDFFIGIEAILKSHKLIQVQAIHKSDSDAEIFRNAAILFAQSLQQAGNDREQWAKLLHILEILEKFSSHEVLRRGFRTMYEKISERNAPLMLN
ncbi:hypothetical protein L596_025327 [Steinernema carpocapsae]|uniref:Protein kinase domain-containing protein n=1 Tax=Steinernema carpocapsae TaxID=34508 RepID=A0A4U5M7G8_STECR|nr:hypothetical protein L596_025327 [Steinernema carpocapsae]